MKEAIVHVEPLRAEVVEVPIPEPKEGEVLIKVICTASNPKDWKVPHWIPETRGKNPGDDMAGYVESVGPGVFQFKKGDRVAAFHVMMSPSGAYAEYGIAPANTTFLLPPNTTFEEASTIPLAAYTAAVGLHKNLGLPTPWLPAREGQSTPLLIYGASSAVGAFAIKLAKIANIHPIIAVCGNGKTFVESLGVDHIVDYREGNVPATIRRVIGDRKCFHAFDCISEKESYVNCCEVLEKKDSKITTVLPVDEKAIPEGIELSRTMVSDVHAGVHGSDCRDFGHVMSSFFSKTLADGRFSGHPQTIVEGGLEGIGKGLQDLMDGKASATKFVYRVAKE